ncbi:MAG TPA: DUF4142 domain-containing protein [Planctomycetota bacterium]|nr:DUF4142 domain-containing protein [Planctomycetota bacterium]
MKLHATVVALFVLATAGRLFGANVDAMTENFVKEAAKGGMHEVAVGKLAMDKATNEDVKKLARHLVDDHSRANDELKQIAGKLNIDLADVAHSPEHDANLMNQSGAQFDRAFVSMVVEDHRKDVANFERYSREGTNPDVKAFATRTLPGLRDHLDMAQSLNDKLGKGAMLDQPADRPLDTTYEAAPSREDLAIDDMGKKDIHINRAEKDMQVERREFSTRQDLNDRDFSYEARLREDTRDRAFSEDSPISTHQRLSGSGRARGEAFIDDMEEPIDVTYTRGSALDCDSCGHVSECSACETRCDDCATEFEEFMYDNDYRAGTTHWIIDPDRDDD